MKKKLRISLIPLILVSFMIIDTSDLFVTSIGGFQDGAWVAPAEADAITNPLEIDEYTMEDGQDVYTANCLACHGEKGDGDTPAAAAFNPKPKNFADGKFIKQSDGAIYWKVTSGRGMMLSYKDILEEEEIWAAIVYVKSLAGE